LVWYSSACKPPPFPSKHNVGHYGQTVPFSFAQTREHFYKKEQSLSPCAVENRSLAFLMVVFEKWLLPCWMALQVMSI
jgi:hypothetical protein